MLLLGVAVPSAWWQKGQVTSTFNQNKSLLLQQLIIKSLLLKQIKISLSAFFWAVLDQACGFFYWSVFRGCTEIPGQSKTVFCRSTKLWWMCIHRAKPILMYALHIHSCSFTSSSDCGFELQLFVSFGLIFSLTRTQYFLCWGPIQIATAAMLVFLSCDICVGVYT